MNPAARAFEAPSQDRLIRRRNRNGTAPMPVARAVTNAATNTVKKVGSAGGAAVGTNQRGVRGSADEALAGADVFIGLSSPGAAITSRRIT
jgi:hypothetical protein